MDISDEPEGFIEDLTGRVEQNPVVIPSRRPRETDEGNPRSPKRSRMAEYTGNTSVVSALSSQSYNDQATALTNSLEAVSYLPKYCQLSFSFMLTLF